MSVPPALTVTKPPTLTVSPTARPPDETTSVPRTSVLLATPPEETYALPPFKFVATAVPPAEMNSTPKNADIGAYGRAAGENRFGGVDNAAVELLADRAAAGGDDDAPCALSRVCTRDSAGGDVLDTASGDDRSDAGAAEVDVLHAPAAAHRRAGRRTAGLDDLLAARECRAARQAAGRDHQAPFANTVSPSAVPPT